ncbi:hypothetical protein CEXT_657341, partial [Caerostris extrusa]
KPCRISVKTASSISLQTFNLAQETYKSEDIPIITLDMMTLLKCKNPSSTEAKLHSSCRGYLPQIVRLQI